MAAGGKGCTARGATARAGGTNQWGATPSILASDKLRATGTVLISCGDHRHPPFQGHSLEIAASLILSQLCSVGNTNQPIMLVINIIPPSTSDARQPASSQLFSVPVNDGGQQAGRIGRVLCQWTCGWITVTSPVKPSFQEITKVRLSNTSRSTLATAAKIMALAAMKPMKPGLEESHDQIHRIRITLSSKNVKNLEKGFFFLLVKVL
ncbi:hypothetical protein OIU79_016001 [Salix purpurea]|uniref:Uncharacterized protein n=1 Tax=Salix purpurea TaxID=77065 RepID=A0A9Q0SQZ7_SALPP|nr:hypothetical protein OIU79_016001 [Salix purpurea]